MKRYRFTIIFLILSILCAVYAFFRIKINADYMVFLPGYRPGEPIEKIDNQDVKALLDVSEKFSDGTQIILILYSEKTFFDRESLQDVLKLQEKLLKIEDIKTVLSVTNYVFKTPYFDGSSLKREIVGDEEAKSFISSDGKYLLLNCILKPLDDQKPALRKIEALLKEYPQLSPVLFGQTVINDQLFKEIIKQMVLYPAMMFLAILIVFYLQTRSIKASFVSLLVPILATIVVYSCVALIGSELNVMTVMTISFVLVIGSAYGLHFYNGILRFGKNVRKKMFKPIFFSMITTAIGFLSFLFVKISAFRQLGLMVSSGLALVFLILFTSGYELLYSENKRNPQAISVTIKGSLIGKTLIVAIIIAVIITPFSLGKIEIGMDQVSYFSKNSEIGKAMKILEREFSYREPVFIMMEKNSIFTVKDGQIIKQIIEKISDLEGVSAVQFPQSYPVPTLAMLSRLQPAVGYFVSNAQTVRLVVNITNDAYTHAGKLKQQLEKILSDYREYKFTVASAAFVVDQINSQILQSQLQSLITSLILIFLMIIIAFRKFWLSIVIAIPVALTALFNFDFIVLFNLKLDIATSIVASILVGLVVDYSIHLAHDMRMTRDISKTISNVGMPILTNALGLIAGFTVMSFSKLALFRNISLLLSLGIGFGVCFTLFSEPLIVQRLVKNNEAGQISRKCKNRNSK